MKYSKQEQQEARERLLQWLKPGDTVYTILRHRSASGMSRRISPILLPTEPGGYAHHLDRSVAILLGIKGDNGEGCTMGGCGMDMGFALVYDLSQALWPDGFDCIGDGCPASDHTNARRARCVMCGADNPTEPTYFKGANGRHPVCSQACAAATWHHNSGGYALKQEWL
jgi:hypothetical protein